MRRSSVFGLAIGLAVAASIAQAQDQNVNGNLTVTGTSSVAGTSAVGSASAASVQLQLLGNATASPFMPFFQNGVRRGFFQFQNFGQEMKFASQFGNVSFFTSPSGSATDRIMTLFSNGNVGIGPILNPGAVALAQLHIKTAGSPEVRIDGGAGSTPLMSFYQNGVSKGSLMYDNSGSNVKLVSNAGGVAIHANNSATPNLYVTPAGDIGVGTSTPATKLDVNGEASVNVINIRGGSDLAERFDIGIVDGVRKIEPGMVACIDPENPGKLLVSSKPYDRTIAGVVSGAGGLSTGVTLSEKGTLAHGEFPVALSGRVYCMADASSGAIVPGDLLTTSSTPGYAMKASDYVRAQGAIIGKAMTSLKSGQTGLVLVLVALQ